ncbi:hypothetical protein ACLM5H_03390 [Fredinandcohnia humi]
MYNNDTMLKYEVAYRHSRFSKHNKPMFIDSVVEIKVTERNEKKEVNTSCYFEQNASCATC